jgi:hypothetical protein
MSKSRGKKKAASVPPGWVLGTRQITSPSKTIYFKKPNNE